MDTRKTPTKDTPGGGGRKALTVVGVLGAIAVNIAAFVLSADAITTVAKAAGISPSIAWAMVLSVDGMMLTGTVVFVTRKIMGRSAKYPGIVLAAGVLLSVACNALHAKATGGQIVHLGGNTRAAVSAIPAASLAFSFHLIADMVKDSLGMHAQIPSADVPVAVEAIPEDTLRETLKDTLKDAPKKDTVKTPRQTPRKTVAKTPAASSGDTRVKARKLLKANPDMNGNELAAALGKEASGYIRTLRNKTLAELAEAGEIPRMRAVSGA